MRILHILKELRPSGVEVMLKLAGESWSIKNCESHIISISNHMGSFAEPLKSAGYKIHLLPFRRGLGTINSLAKYACILNRIKPDVVHVHSEGLSVFTISIPALMGYPVLRSVQNTFQYKGLTKYQKIFERAISRMFGCVYISASESVRRNEEVRLLNHSHLIWNWFDATHFRLPTSEERKSAREKLGITENQTALISVGNGNDVKNYPAIIEALSHPSQLYVGAHPKEIIYLMVGNEHPDGFERRKAEELKLTDIVLFCGPQINVRDYLWAADIYLMPSHFEGFGLAAAEALACGLPCIFSKRPSLVDFKDFGIKAIWCDTSADDIRNALKIALSTAQSELENEGKTNSEIIRDAFSVVKRAAEYFEKWEEAHKRK
jgi:glycosyltransferase involved in cell wall biosynthesis